MSVDALKWAMTLPFDAIPNPAARAVLVALSWLQKGAEPVYACVPHLHEATSFDPRTIRCALSYLNSNGFIEPTGLRHRNMPYFVLRIGARPLTKVSGFNGSQPLTNLSGFDESEPSQFCTRPLTLLHSTPDVFVRERSKQRKTKRASISTGARVEHEKAIEELNLDRPDASASEQQIHAALAQLKRRSRK